MIVEAAPAAAKEREKKIINESSGSVIFFESLEVNDFRTIP